MKNAGIIEQPQYHAQLSLIVAGFLRTECLIIVIVAHFVLSFPQFSPSDPLGIFGNGLGKPHLSYSWQSFNVNPVPSGLEWLAFKFQRLNDAQSSGRKRATSYLCTQRQLSRLRPSPRPAI